MCDFVLSCLFDTDCKPFCVESEYICFCMCSWANSSYQSLRVMSDDKKINDAEYIGFVVDVGSVTECFCSAQPTSSASAHRNDGQLSDRALCHSPGSVFTLRSVSFVQSVIHFNLCIIDICSIQCY